MKLQSIFQDKENKNVETLKMKKTLTNTTIIKFMKDSFSQLLLQNSINQKFKIL